MKLLLTSAQKSAFYSHHHHCWASTEFWLKYYQKCWKNTRQMRRNLSHNKSLMCFDICLALMKRSYNVFYLFVWKHSLIGNDLFLIVSSIYSEGIIVPNEIYYLQQPFRPDNRFINVKTDTIRLNWTGRIKPQRAILLLI